MFRTRRNHRSTNNIPIQLLSEEEEDATSKGLQMVDGYKKSSIPASMVKEIRALGRQNRRTNVRGLGTIPERRSISTRKGFDAGYASVTEPLS